MPETSPAVDLYPLARGSVRLSPWALLYPVMVDTQIATARVRGPRDQRWLQW